MATRESSVAGTFILKVTLVSYLKVLLLVASGVRSLVFRSASLRFLELGLMVLYVSDDLSGRLDSDGSGLVVSRSLV